MDRIKMGSMIFLAFALAAPSALGGGSGQDEEFPESRFGQTPQHVDLGVGKGYAAKEADEWNGPSRRPAGLEFEGEASKPKAVSQEPATQNPPTQAAEPVRVREDNGVDDEETAPPRSAHIDAGEARRKGVQEVAIIASDLGFFPRTVFVSRDVPVRMFVTGSSKNTLCIMMDSFQVRKQLKSQKIEEITFTPNVPGKYRFYCPVNGMEGNLIVKELTSSLASQ